MTRIALKIIAILNMVGLVLHSVLLGAIRLSNPELTETQLFIEAWPNIAWILGHAFIVMWLMAAMTAKTTRKQQE